MGNRFPWKQKQSHLLRLGGGGKSVKSSWRKYISHKSIKKLINLQLEARMRVRSLELKISGLEIKFSKTGGCKPPFYFSFAVELPRWLSGEVCLPMEETPSGSLIWEDLTCHNY